MGDGWRVCIAFGVLPRRLHSFRRALIPAVGSRLGDQVAVSSSATRIFLYALSMGLADEAAQVAREVLAQRDISAPVRTEFWSHRDQKWRDAAGTVCPPIPPIPVPSSTQTVRRQSGKGR